MNLKYKIVEVHPESHSIVVRFYTDAITEQSLATQTTDGTIVRCRTDYSIDLPVPPPHGAELAAFITARAPKAWLQTQEAVLDGNIDTSLSSLTNLIGVETVAVVQEPQATARIPVVTL